MSVRPQYHQKFQVGDLVEHIRDVNKGLMHVGQVIGLDDTADPCVHWIGPDPMRDDGEHHVKKQDGHYFSYALLPARPEAVEKAVALLLTM